MDNPFQTVCIGLGANLGDRRANLDHAQQRLARLPEVAELQASNAYQTTPVGWSDQGEFLNAAVRFETAFEPRQLLAHLHRIEADLGRPSLDQRQRWGPRVIDLDMLLFGQQVIEEPGLVVPHPAMHERWFVLRPLADIAPDVVHPVLGKSVSQLLSEIPSS